VSVYNAYYEHGLPSSRHCPRCGDFIPMPYVGHACRAARLPEPRHGSGGASIELGEHVALQVEARVLAIDYVRERVLMRLADGDLVELDATRGVSFR
jgi:hypothetical protein